MQKKVDAGVTNVVHLAEVTLLMLLAYSLCSDQHSGPKAARDEH